MVVSRTHLPNVQTNSAPCNTPFGLRVACYRFLGDNTNERLTDSRDQDDTDKAVASYTQSKIGLLAFVANSAGRTIAPGEQSYL